MGLSPMRGRSHRFDRSVALALAAAIVALAPAGLLWAYRFLADSRDTATRERLSELDDPFSVFRCRSILNCTNMCPKGLNPRNAISKIEGLLVREGT